MVVKGSNSDGQNVRYEVEGKEKKKGRNGTEFITLLYASSI